MAGGEIRGDPGTVERRPTLYAPLICLSKSLQFVHVEKYLEWRLATHPPIYRSIAYGSGNTTPKCEQDCVSSKVVILPTVALLSIVITKMVHIQQIGKANAPV